MNKLDILALIILGLIFGCLTYLVVVNGRVEQPALECLANCKYELSF